ncbi:zinc transporter ZIP1-like [Lycorma delicatula]|uniref:zinc transporter ZIP1-like n=1 Tax=Lycorma delicatula TaxID=130591 RepID=UPI003F518562
MTTLATYLQRDETVSDMENHTHSHSNLPELHLSAGSPAGLIPTKVVAMITLGLVSFLLGMVPVKLATWLRYKKTSKVTISGQGGSKQQPAIISLLLCYGGGVLLFTTFLHLQPEVREGVEHLIESGKMPDWLADSNLSVSDIAFCCGFFFVYIVEESVHWLLDRHGHDQAEEEVVLHRTMSLRRCSMNRHHRDHHAPVNGAGIIPRASLSPSPATANSQFAVTKTESSTESAGGSGNGSVTASTQGLFLREQISVVDMKTSDHSPLDAQIRMTGGPLADEPRVGFKGHIDNDSYSKTTVVAKSFRGLLAVLALSFHAIFEGLAVGLEKSVRNVWYMFAAIATHKFVIAFCVGIGLVSSDTRLPLIVVYVATFAMVTPIGIGIGIALSEEDITQSTDSLLPVLLQGMAAGTLLYVIFFEVLQRERNNTQSGALQLAAIIAGFCTMLFLQLLMGHEHHHHHHHGEHEELGGADDHHHDHDHHSDSHNHHHHHHT